MHIEEADASGRDSRINHKGEDGKGALTAEIYAFKIDVHSWRVWDWRRMAEDEPVDQITDLLHHVDNLCLDVPHIKFRLYIMKMVVCRCLCLCIRYRYYV